MNMLRQKDMDVTFYYANLSMMVTGSYYLKRTNHENKLDWKHWNIPCIALFKKIHNKKIEAIREHCRENWQKYGVETFTNKQIAISLANKAMQKLEADGWKIHDEDHTSFSPYVHLVKDVQTIISFAHIKQEVGQIITMKNESKISHEDFIKEYRLVQAR